MEECMIPVAHIDDNSSIGPLLTALRMLHGSTYEFAVGEWGGEVQIIAPPGALLYRFCIETTGAHIELETGDLIRGIDATKPLRPVAVPSAAPPQSQQVETHDQSWAEVTTTYSAELWPGDVVVATDEKAVTLSGQGRYFEVTVESTDYCAPRAAFLRHLVDQPGGCAAYPGAFRREAIPPQRPASSAKDQRGVNRINEHTLDMRIDRTPTPIRHFHGPIPVGDEESAGQAMVNHSEIAIVLARAVYDLPEVDQPDQGHVLIYRQPAIDPTDIVTIPVHPGSIIVTPATPEQTMGHCFENCFAMLIAIPGFVAPYHMLAE